VGDAGAVVGALVVGAAVVAGAVEGGGGGAELTGAPTFAGCERGAGHRNAYSKTEHQRADVIERRRPAVERVVPVDIASR
jgi:hypothetical protein